MRRCIEDLGNLLVDMDEKVLLLDDLGVSLSNSLLDPGPEFIAQNGKGYVGNPLSRQLKSVWMLREVYVDLLVPFKEDEHLLDGERLVVRDGKVGDFIANQSLMKMNLKTKKWSKITIY